MLFGKRIEDWKAEYPAVADILNREEVMWLNPRYDGTAPLHEHDDVHRQTVAQAKARLERFEPLLRSFFQLETNEKIESPVTYIADLQSAEGELPGTWLLKRDDLLPTAGSIKARGGFHEVFRLAEQVSANHGMLPGFEAYEAFQTQEMRELFQTYRVHVGSTGNLGLSIGLMSAVLGFQATVHMSSDAKTWKKEMLQSYGVTVKEYTGDYSKAVTSGRELCRQTPGCYFVDDEASPHLFNGYAAAGTEVKAQLRHLNIRVSKDTPLFVYLPCGVGGGPAGVAYGLKQMYGPNVHCFFSEPVESPAVLLGLLTGAHEKLAVQHFGLTNETIADGLAVGRPSRLACQMMDTSLSGAFTVKDEELARLQKAAYDTEGIKLEPSAAAGLPGAAKVLASGYVESRGIDPNRITHLSWSTGGSLVPSDIFAQSLSNPFS